MESMIAYCGLNCADCPAYQASRTKDQALMEAVLIHWREAFDAPDITLADICCDGCQAEGRLNGYCSQCQVRACAQDRGIANCAFCAEYPCAELDHLLSICDRQRGFFGYARPARATLARIQGDLG